MRTNLREHIWEVVKMAATALCAYIFVHIFTVHGLSERVYVCENCHCVIDRDWNASRNLKRLAASSSESINACQSREVHVDAISSYQVPANEAGIEHQIGDVLNG